MIYRFSALGLLALAACSTPQERCIAAATQDLRVVSGFIAESEANIARGYAIGTRLTTETDRVNCIDSDGNETTCLVQIPVEKKVRVAIDLDAEAAKLASLKRKQAEQQRMADAAVKQCARTYPES